MALPRRQFLHLVGIAAALPAVSRIAWAQTYPARPIHWIVSFTAGGPNDTVARIIGQYLSERLGQQFLIENKVGAGGERHDPMYWSRGIDLRPCDARDGRQHGSDTN